MTDASTRVLGGRYQLARLLGEGAMGAVYEANHTWTGRRVGTQGERLRDRQGAGECDGNPEGRADRDAAVYAARASPGCGRCRRASGRLLARGIAVRTARGADAIRRTAARRRLAGAHS